MRPLGCEPAHRSSGEVIEVVGALTGAALLPSRVNISLTNQKRRKFGAAPCPLHSAKSWLEEQGVTAGSDHLEHCQALFFSSSTLRCCACPVGHVHFSRSEMGKDLWNNVILLEFTYAFWFVIF